MSARLKPLTPDLSAVHRFGALLRRLRIEAGFSQPELATRLYTSKSTLSRAETGVRLLARDLAEASDELLGAAGTLLAAWLHADSVPSVDSPGERPRRSSPARTFIPCLCTLALRAPNALGGFDPSFPAATKTRRAEAITATAHRTDGRPDHYWPLDPSSAERGRQPLPQLGDALPAPPPTGSSLRAVAQPRPAAGRPAHRESLGGGILNLNYALGHSPFAVAAMAASRV